MGHKVTLCDADGETETLARYPSHDDAKRHVADYCRWDGAEWDIANNYQRADASDGRELTITPAAVYTHYRPGNVESDPRHGVLEWSSGVTSLDGLKLIACDHSSLDAVENSVGANSVGVMLPGSDLDGYLDAHERKTVDPPKYYSRFPDKGSKSLLEGPSRDNHDDGGSILNASIVEVGIRVLNGDGRYPASEFTLHDCLPYPCIISREGVGHVVVTPRIESE